MKKLFSKLEGKEKPYTKMCFSTVNRKHWKYLLLLWMNDHRFSKNNILFWQDANTVDILTQSINELVWKTVENVNKIKKKEERNNKVRCECS